MDRPALLVVAPIPPELKTRLSRDYELVQRRPLPGETVPGYPVMVTMSIVGADAATMAALPDLGLVACGGAGVDKIDFAEAERRGIVVRNTPDVVTEDTADAAIGLCYALVRRIAEADRFVRSGAWATRRMTPSRRLFSRRMGIVGLGKIGTALALRGSAIGMEVSYTGPREKPGVPYAYVPDLQALARNVDILVITCPANRETEKLVGREVLAALGPEGYLINISRGSTVDEAALIQALQTGAIAGAGLDVFENEPDIDARFFSLDNVVLSPHYASVTAETRTRMADELGEAIDTFFQTRRT